MSDFDAVYIGVTGLAGSGKDTFCNLLMENSGKHIIAHRVAMADPLKRVVAEMYGVHVHMFHDRDKKEQNIVVDDVVMRNDLGEPVTPRYLLQQFGTEIVRNMDTDHWVKRFPIEVTRVVKGFQFAVMYGGVGDGTDLRYNYTRKMQQKFKSREFKEDEIHLIVVPDIRFSNEQQMIRDLGGTLIDVKRDNLDVGDMDFSHASESSIDNTIKPDFEIDNDTTLPNLEIKAIAVLNQLGLR